MNGEIKEILEKIKNWCDSALDDNCNTIMYKYEFVAILDYITNLQQINKNLTNSLNKKVEEGIKLQLKNERLNNIINELEKWLNEEYEATIFDYRNAIEDVLNKLKELKGDSSNE